MRAGSFIAAFGLALGSLSAGEITGCLELDGVESRAEIRGIEGFESLDGDSTFTFQAWIKPRTQGGAGRGRLLDQVGSSLTWYLSDEGRFGFRPNRTMGWQICDANAISYWKWQHVAVTSDGQVLRFFVNGELLNAIPGPTILSLTKKPVWIGNGEGEDKTARGFDGWLDDLLIESACRWTEDFTPPARGMMTEPDSSTVMAIPFDQLEGKSVALDQSAYNSVLNLKSGAALAREP